MGDDDYDQFYKVNGKKNMVENLKALSCFYGLSFFFHGFF